MGFLTCSRSNGITSRFPNPKKPWSKRPLELRHAVAPEEGSLLQDAVAWCRRTATGLRLCEAKYSRTSRRCRELGENISDSTGMTPTGGPNSTFSRNMVNDSFVSVGQVVVQIRSKPVATWVDHISQGPVKDGGTYLAAQENPEPRSSL